MSKFTLNPRNVRFFVQPEKRRVVCVIEDTRGTFNKFVSENCKTPLEGCLEKTMNQLYDQCLMPDRFTGIAICSEDDVWDENVGKLLAYHRARAKFDQSFFRHAQTYIATLGEWLDDAVDSINAYGDKLATNEKYREKKLKELIEEDIKND